MSKRTELGVMWPSLNSTDPRCRYIKMTRCLTWHILNQIKVRDQTDGRRRWDAVQPLGQLGEPTPPYVIVTSSGSKNDQKVISICLPVRLMSCSRMVWTSFRVNTSELISGPWSWEIYKVKLHNILQNLNYRRSFPGCSFYSLHNLWLSLIIMMLIAYILMLGLAVSCTNAITPE